MNNKDNKAQFYSWRYWVSNAIILVCLSVILFGLGVMIYFLASALYLLR